MSGLSPRQQAAAERLLDRVGPLRTRYCPLTPTPKQEAFLRLRQLEALYGGAAGGGKSIALLMCALMYADVPGYAALLLRRSLAEFGLPGGLLEIAARWLGGTDAVWNGDQRSWRFPGPGRSGAGGATLTFGYLDNINDTSRYAGSSFSFVGFDELARFDQTLYTAMFRAVRQPDPFADVHLPAPDGLTLADVPPRIRATSNPGGPRHDWIRSYFVRPETRAPGVIFLPSALNDNPHLDRDSYMKTLEGMPTVMRERLLHGNWEIPDEGTLFQREWLPVIGRTQLPPTTSAVRYWDLAGTEPSASAPDPDWTVGLRLDYHASSRTYTVTDIVRIRKPPGTVEQIVAQTAERDGPEVTIRIEREPGSAGLALVRHYARDVVPRYTVRGHQVTTAKEIRAYPVAAAAENGLISLLRIRGVDEFLDELGSFPNGPHDDCVDAFSGAYSTINPHTGSTRILSPNGTILPKQRARTAASTRAQIEQHHRGTTELGIEYGLPVYNPYGWQL